MGRNTKISADDARFVRTAVEKHYDEIYFFLCRRCGNEEIAKDICQNTFVRFSCSIGGYMEKGSLRSYLFKIAVNCCNDYYRQNREHLPLESACGISTGYADSPEHSAESGEDGQKVRRILNSLPPIQRDVLILRYYHDMKPREIGACLGLKTAGVKTRLYRAKQAFIREWENE